MRDMLFVDDDEDMRWVADQSGLTTTDNAEDADRMLRSGEFKVAMLDVHGIQRNGHDVHSLIATCRQHGIEFFVTTSDPLKLVELTKLYPGIKGLSKTQAVRYRRP